MTGPFGERAPLNDETPGQIISGREFRETETDSSANYPIVGSSLNSLTSGDALPPVTTYT